MSAPSILSIAVLGDHVAVLLDDDTKVLVRVSMTYPGTSEGAYVRDLVGSLPSCREREVIEAWWEHCYEVDGAGDDELLAWMRAREAA